MPYTSIKDAPKALVSAGLTLSQINIWARFYDAAKASGAAISPAAVAWTQFKRKYKKVGKKWFKRAKTLARAPIEKIIFTHWGTEAIRLKPEKLAKKISELSQKHSPDIPVEIAIDNLKLGPPKKGERKPRERVFIEEYALSNYLGSKRAYVKEIFKYVPQGTKTLFDPMMGVCHALIEAARRGIQVIGNDLSPLAFLYSAGIFQGLKLNEEDIKKLKNSPPVAGWLSKSGLMRPKKGESKRLLDGLVINAWRNFSGSKRKAALAVVSLLVQHYFRGFQAFISEEEPYSKAQIQKDLDTAIKEINSLIEAVGGRGKIFNRDILKEKIPRADVIYFDPPFFPSGIKHNIEYFKHYKIANSFLMQKTYQPKEPSQEEITKFLSRLAGRAKTLIVSSASPSKISWEKELGKLKKNVKRVQLAKTSTGSQPQGYPGHIDKPLAFRENLFCASDAEIKVTRKSEVPLFRLAGYDPSKINDAQLDDDLRLVCFPEGTRIWDGWNGKPIEKFRVGDEIQNGSSYGTIKKIYKRRYKGELIKIKPGLLPAVSVTPEHPVRIMEGKRCGHFGRFCRPPKCSGHERYQYVRRIPFEERLRALEESKNGDVKTVAKKFGIHYSTLYNWRRGEKILDAKRRPLFLDSGIKWKPAAELKPKSDFLLIPRMQIEMNRKPLDLTKFVNPWKKTEHREISMKYGEGKFWFDRRDKLPRFIPITEDLMNISGWYLAEGFGAGGGLRFSFSKRERKFAEEILNQLKLIFQKNGTLIELETEIRLNYYSPLLEKIFRKLFGSGAHNKKIPDFIQSVGKEFQFVFLKAYWHGDGSFKSMEKNKRIGTVSENIIWNLLSICNGNGLIPSTNSHLVKTGFKTPKPVISRELCFNSGGFRRSFNKNYGIDDKFFYLPVSKISKEFFDGNVYNFEVEPENTYCVPFIVHNCAKYSSMLSGKKTEFRDKEQLLKFAERVMKEVLRRGKITFHPKYRIEAGRAKVVKK